ncbi:MAG TPA: twin-arginine translocase TatA/TatE family subunit [Candidatus Polarisedimenticolaceae bacterium]|nr:twin-arginine translocase TatA/TatE family subunit [Candidatus Polarisedimenticolaceae bacterium]
MFGSLGGPEVIFLFILALLLFGPRRLPEIGRTLGKTMADFRRATTDFKINLEREVELESVKEAARAVEAVPRPETLARGVLDPEIPAAVKPDADDGDPGSIH